MIDIHNHILWGIDDGAKDFEESLAMAKIAVEDGIKQIVATPHFMNGTYKSSKEIIKEKADILNKKLKEENIDLEIILGNEVFLNIDSVEKIKKGEVYPINNTKYILIEFSFMNIPQNADRIIHQMMKEGYRPIIAHPERISSVVEDPSILIPYIEMGCMTQITSGSILGYFGDKVKKASEEIIKRDMAYTIASDAHNAKTRKPKLSKAYRRIGEISGEKYVKELKRRTYQIIYDKDIEYLEPKMKSKKSFLKRFFNKN